MKKILVIVIFYWIIQSSFGRNVSSHFADLRTLTGQIIRPASIYSLPTLIIDSPLSYSTATPLLHVKARCVDANGCWLRIALDMNQLTGAQYFDTGDAVDTVLDLTEYDQRNGILYIYATSNSDYVEQDLPIFVETSHYLKPIFSGYDMIFDFNFNKVLISNPFMYGPGTDKNPFIHRSRIVDITTGDSTIIPYENYLLPYPGRYGGSYLTYSGAIIDQLDTVTFLNYYFDWNNNTLYPLDQANSAGSMKVSGNYASWSNDTILYLRNLQTVSNNIISNTANNGNNDLTRNGEVVYAAHDSNNLYANRSIFRYTNGVSSKIANNTTTIANDGPLTDGKRIIYVRTDTSYRIPYRKYSIQLNDGQIDTTISDMDTIPIRAYVNYLINNGFIAFTKLDASKLMQIWLMDSVGNQWHVASANNNYEYFAIEQLSSNGDLTYVSGLNFGSRYFANRTTKQVTEISSWSGTTFFRDSSWYLALGRMLYKIDVQVSLNSKPITAIVSPLISGLDSNYCANQRIQKIKILNLPDTTKEVYAYASLDNTNLPIAPDSSFSFDVSNLTSVEHEVKVIYSYVENTTFLDQQFTVNSFVAPDVTLSSNISTVRNTTIPIIITASNKSGGGADPLYTFAKDRNFTKILRAEGSSNMLNINPGTLDMGVNEIYVRMKTSDTCSIFQTSTDSIQLLRNTTTGMIDPDFPNQTINIFPNPFNKYISINGINSSKTYLITIFNAVGQTVFQQQVSNTNSINLDESTIQTGSYWLSIYDFTKNKLIGTESVLKD